MHRLLIILLSLIVAGCTTLELRVEQPAELDQAALGTLAALMLEGTQSATILASLELTPQPPDMPIINGQISGRICYPGTTTPPLIAYFRNIATEEMVELSIQEYQEGYTVALTPGTYYAFTWAPQYLLGGLYSQAVVCGGGVDCTDHSPVPITIATGDMLEEINFCDWGIPASNLPLPTGTQLPGVEHTKPLWK